MRAYEAVSDACGAPTLGAAGDGAVLARVATGQFDGVPVAVGASPVYATASDDEAVVFVGFYPPVTQADALKFADDVALDPAAAMETLMAGRQMVSGVDFSHLVLVGTNLSFPVAKHFTPPKGGGKPPTSAISAGPGRRRSLEAKAQCRRFAVLVVTADGEHSAAVNACNEYVAAFADGSVPQPLEALISAAPGLREFLRAERPLCLVDFVHSLRRIWGKSQDYFLLGRRARLDAPAHGSAELRPGRTSG
ncbi:hypothetical protein JL721_10890 [Aureococcus anophagefferens]|nr:hypothetical protein JL721_10890 [Aureococcus anophagefferens]